MAQADVLTIPGHVASDHQMMLPRPGSSMDRVLSEFGEPVNRKPAVGDPPITEWDYGDFLVYFEYQTVLHTVNLKTLIMPK
jgi:hypothetical protein